MSASLVGSEMCIRDSWRTGHPCPRAPVGRSLPTGAPAAARRLSSTQAVSYTHLTLPTICSV
eukprot:11932211-Alexandrium_andersonii.AAC.1